eukprot:g3598.t1
MKRKAPSGNGNRNRIVSVEREDSPSCSERSSSESPHSRLIRQKASPPPTKTTKIVRRLHQRHPLRGSSHRAYGRSARRRNPSRRERAIDNLSVGDFKRLARRGGIRRVQNETWEEIRGSLDTFLRQTIRDTMTITEHARRLTVIPNDVVYALKRRGMTLYGFGGFQAFRVHQPKRSANSTAPRNNNVNELTDQDHWTNGQIQTGESGQRPPQTARNVRLRRSEVDNQGANEDTANSEQQHSFVYRTQYQNRRNNRTRSRTHNSIAAYSNNSTRYINSSTVDAEDTHQIGDAYRTHASTMVPTTDRMSNGALSTEPFRGRALRFRNADDQDGNDSDVEEHHSTITGDIENTVGRNESVANSNNFTERPKKTGKKASPEDNSIRSGRRLQFPIDSDSSSDGSVSDENEQRLVSAVKRLETEENRVMIAEDGLVYLV